MTWNREPTEPDRDRTLPPSKLRRQIAWQAARLMFYREESEYYRAKMKAARSVHAGWVKPADLPSNAEIHDQIRVFASLMEGDRHPQTVREMRVEAFRLMHVLQRFQPRLIGSVLSGHIRHGSDIDLHVFADSAEPVRAELEFHGWSCQLQEKRVVKDGQRRRYRHLHLRTRFPIEITVYPLRMVGHAFRSSITGKAIEWVSLPQLKQLLAIEYPELDLEAIRCESEVAIDRFQIYHSLLLPLENVKQPRQYHPEGDALYHSLQVFDLACDQLPYDEEFLLAALLHDVGKAIDPRDHIAAGLEALDDFITPRTAWLIAHHMDAHRIADRTIGARARRRLESNESFPELVLLGECDRQGRVSGVDVTEVDDALDYIRDISDQFNSWVR